MMRSMRRKFSIHSEPAIIPGYKRLLDPHYDWKLKFVWMAAVLVCVSPCFIQIGIRLNDYLNYPVTINIYMKRLNLVKFPPVLLCTDEMLSVFKEKWANCSKNNNQCIKWKDIGDFNATDLGGIMTQLSHMDKEKIKLEKHCPFFEDCTRKVVTEDADDTTLQTIYGECLVLTLRKEMSFKGPNTWIMISWNHTEIVKDLDDDNDRDRVYVSLTDENWTYSAHNALYNSETLRVGFKYNMRITAKEFNQIGNPKNPCVKHQELLKCQTDCYDKKLCEVMQCRLPFIANGYCKECETFNDSIHAFVQAEKFYIQESFSVCNCNRPCNEQIYKLHVDNKQVTDDGATSIKLLYSDDILEVYNETLSFTTTELISEIGGSIGLYLGVCLLSVFEIVEILMYKCKTKVKPEQKMPIGPRSIRQLRPFHY